MMTQSHTRSGFLTVVARPLVRIRDCIKGVAAVEFGLLIPVLLTFWLGSNEFGQALMLDRRVTTTASAVADLVAQTDTLTEDQIDEILGLSDQLMAPALMNLYKPNNFRIDVMHVIKNEDGELTVDWAREKTGGGAGPSTQFPEGAITAAEIDENFDPEVILDNSSQVIAKVEYDYTPTVGRFIKRDLGGTIKLKETFFLAPRKGIVVCSDCSD